jgi:hypothetical protein
MTRFVWLTDANGVEHIINVDHIIRMQKFDDKQCLVVVTGLDIQMSQPLSDVWKSVYKAAAG